MHTILMPNTAYGYLHENIYIYEIKIDSRAETQLQRDHVRADAIAFMHADYNSKKKKTAIMEMKKKKVK